MKCISLFILATMVIQSFCLAGVTKLPADDQKVLREVSRFHAIHGATNLPPVVFALCADSRGRLAEPGQKWQVTDAITDDKLPDRKSTRLNSSHMSISYAVFCLKKKKRE